MENIAKDRLNGAAAIAGFIGEPLRRTFHLLEQKLIPAGKQGGRWVASKSALQEHYAKLVRGEGHAA
jgi:hypothetical protein